MCRILLPVFTSFTAGCFWLIKLISRFACSSYSKRRLDQKHDEDFEVEDDDEEERDKDVEFALAYFLKKGKGKSSKRPGRNLDGFQKV